MDNSSSQFLDRLCMLLNVSARPDSVAGLTIEQFQAWKPIAERLAREHRAEATEIAGLLVGVAYESEEDECIAFAWWIAGNIYHELGLYRSPDGSPSASDAYRKSEELYRARGEHLNIARMSVGWVHVLGELTQYEEALHRAAAAIETLRQSTEDLDQKRLAWIYTNLGIIYEQLGRLVEALACYQRRLDYFASLPEQTRETAYQCAMGLNDIGFLQLLLGQYFEADESFRAALKLLAAYRADPDIRPDITLLKMNQALLAVLRQSEYHTVRKAFQQARESRAQHLTPSAAHFYAQIDLGEMNWLLRNGRIQDVDVGALERLYHSTHQAGREFEATYAQLLRGEIEYHNGQLENAQAHFARLCQESPDKMPTFVYLAHLWQARVLRQMNQWQQAEDVLLKAIQLIEGSLQQFTLDSYRAGYLEDKLVAYHDLVDLYIQRGQAEAALRVIERSKARTLAEMLAAQRAQNKGIQEQQPHHASWSLPALTNHLPANCLVISYAVVHQQVWVFLLNQYGLVTAPIPVGQRPERAAIEMGLSCIQQVLYTSGQTTAEWSEQKAIAQETLATWFSAYLAPLRPWLEQYERLLICPDALLNTLPFACFYDSERRQYLTETHEISIVPSLAVWAMLPAVPAIHDELRQPEVLILGNSSIGGVPDQLPRAVQEACEIAQLFPSATLWTEQEATFARCVQSAGDARLLYIAAHGEYCIGEPAASFVELADHPLRVRDILDLKLPGTIVVLSACETSKGYLTGNESMGLVRAFLYAGASAVVATHWPVADEATFFFMRSLMHKVRHGRSFPAAFRDVQQEFLHSQDHHLSHPFFWGALTVVGAKE